MRSTYGWFLALMLIGAGLAHAQETGPWKVVVTSTANPLRVAECSPVRIDVSDAKGNARNPKGVLISLADFDLSVTAGRDGAIVGRYDGASAWSACACPGAAGATATITATYPARSLPPESRMPGVTFQSSINVPVIAGRSSAIPIGCEVVKTTTVNAGRDVAPWAVTIVPSLRAIPIGNCAPVYIDLRDPIVKSSPRNPKGVFVSLGDFDMTVTAAASGAVVGRTDGANAWSVCGCQGAAVGTMATITATYPARALADASRVPGVAFQASTTISLAAATGTFNPPACVSPQPSAIAPASSSRVLTPAPAVATAPGAAAAGGAAGAAAGSAAGAAAGGAAGGSSAGRAEGAGTAAGGAVAGTAAGKAGGAGAAGGGAAAAGGAKTEAAAGGAVAAAGGGAAGAAAAGAAAAGAAGGAAAAGAKGEATVTGAAPGAAAGAAAKGGATTGGAAAGDAASAKTEAAAGGAVAGAGAAGGAGAAAAGSAGAATGGAATGAAAGRAATTPGRATASFALTGRGVWSEPGTTSAQLDAVTGRSSVQGPNACPSQAGCVTLSLNANLQLTTLHPAVTHVEIECNSSLPDGAVINARSSRTPVVSRGYTGIVTTTMNIPRGAIDSTASHAVPVSCKLQLVKGTDVADAVASATGPQRVLDSNWGVLATGATVSWAQTVTFPNTNVP